MIEERVAFKSIEPIDGMKPIPPEVLRKFSEQMQIAVETSIAEFSFCVRQVGRFFDPTFRPGPALSWETVLSICRINDRIRARTEAEAFSPRNINREFSCWDEGGQIDPSKILKIAARLRELNRTRIKIKSVPLYSTLGHSVFHEYLKVHRPVFLEGIGSVSGETDFTSKIYFYR